MDPIPQQVSELKVYFLNPDILEDEHWKCGHEGPLTVDTILAWATFWNGHAEYYPKISNYKAEARKAHIRVEFTKNSEYTIQLYQASSSTRYLPRLCNSQLY